MLYDAKRGQTGIGYVVNAITWFNLLWLHRESIVAELRAMQPSQQVADAIRWMEQELPKSRSVGCSLDRYEIEATDRAHSGSRDRGGY